MQKNIANALLFNAVWLLCVLGGNVVALFSTLALLLAHFRFVSSDWRELVLALQALVIGFFVDAMMLQSGVLIAPDASVMPPAWLLCLWVAFSTTLNHSMAWLQNRLLLSVLVGALLVPLSYYAGTRLTDFALAEPLWRSIAMVGASWALVLPLLAWLAVRNRERFLLSREGLVERG
ncbi:MAG: DUF2878 domain-containing protein [Pseudomonadales bacterium]